MFFKKFAYLALIPFYGVAAQDYVAPEPKADVKTTAVIMGAIENGFTSVTAGYTGPGTEAQNLVKYYPNKSSHPQNVLVILAAIAGVALNFP